MSTDTDRRVHARFNTGMEVVRYDRGGRWYLEWKATDGSTKRKRVTIKEAVDGVRAALGKGHVTVFPGLHGGGAFDRKVGA